jgi:hypothetical protein
MTSIKEEEFNLSKKIKWAYSEEGFVNGLDVVPLNDVKEFIKKRNEDRDSFELLVYGRVLSGANPEIICKLLRADFRERWKKEDKLAGDKLK